MTSVTAILARSPTISLAELAIISHHGSLGDAEWRTEIGWPLFRADSPA
jgi:hypothetical protein